MGIRAAGTAHIEQAILNQIIKELKRYNVQKRISINAPTSIEYSGIYNTEINVHSQRSGLDTPLRLTVTARIPNGTNTAEAQDQLNYSLHKMIDKKHDEEPDELPVLDDFNDDKFRIDFLKRDTSFAENILRKLTAKANLTPDANRVRFRWAAANPSQQHFSLYDDYTTDKENHYLEFSRHLTVNFSDIPAVLAAAEALQKELRTAGGVLSK